MSNVREEQPENSFHLNIEKQVAESVRIARKQGSWTTVKSLMRQAELLNESDTKIYKQMKVHLKRVEKELPYNPYSLSDSVDETK